MNNILCLYKNNGSVVEPNGKDIMVSDFNYAQIALAGNHADKTDNGNIMLVSQCDIDIANKFKWYLNSNGYPATYGTHDGDIKFSRPVPFHLILYANSVPSGYVIDHINRDRLDNRRENLRMCTPLQNSYNKSKPKNSHNTYKGVTKVGTKNPTYTASITKEGVKREMKRIPTERQAAEMYDLMAEELFGEYAAKNFK
jgi:hypothetical protein